ncbi:hypothetical protein COB11_05860 [Candidatus Aerophobetes bacterium]|uniref:Methyltransferase type 11 domain-containing protein n=1 Tax=Aerophobetes bacterium TaxID=2030807 RepID=A0A2A4YEI5_UNCAE|nr:MAG: hypothetical protein COB11_05860 [Candidatus Aerophobetes bacterium]
MRYLFFVILLGISMNSYGETTFKTFVKDVFNRSAELYGMDCCNYFNDIGKRLTDEITLKANDCVLDLATGTGAALLPLAKRERGASFIGIDICVNMVKRAILASDALSLTNVRFQLMDAENLEFADESFDVVTCSLGLFFFPEIEKALSEIYRVLKPSGTFVISLFDKPDQEHTMLALSIAKELGAIEEDEAIPLDEDKADCYMLSAGFTKLRSTPYVAQQKFPCPSTFIESFYGHGLRHVLDQLSEDGVLALKNKLIARIGPGPILEYYPVIYLSYRK